MRYLCIVISFCWISSASGQLDSTQIKKIEALMSGFAGQNPGMSLSIVHIDGQQFYSNKGLKHYGHQAECNSQTRYNVASLAKHITAKWAFEIIRRKICDIDDPITKHLDWLPEFYSKISIKNLIEHTSGLREFHTMQQLRGESTKKPIKAKQIHEDLMSFQELNFEPGTRHVYSNTGYYLLYKICEKLASENMNSILMWESFSEIHGLNNSFWQEGRRRRSCARGHVYHKSFVPINSKEAVGGYSNLWVTAEDMSKWMISTLRDKAFVEATQDVSRLENNVQLKYNYGLIKSNFMAWDVLEHGGIARGFRSQVRYIPATGCGICLMLNSDVVNPADYVDRITEIILNQDHDFEGVEIMGQVVDEDFKPIPFAVIQTHEEHGGALANDSGFFHYRTREYADMVKFSRETYLSVEVSTENWDKPQFIKLAVAPRDAMKEPFTERTYLNLDRSFEMGSIAPWVPVPGAEVVRRFQHKHKESHLDTLSAFITEQSKWDTPFRFVVYRMNEYGMPRSLPVYESEPIMANEKNAWVVHKVPQRAATIRGHFFVGIQWLYAAGRRGEDAQYLGFKMNENHHESYYRVPFDKWRRLGEIMFRGNRDVMIECAFSHGGGELSMNETKDGFLFDETYSKIMPLHIEHGHLFIEPYPDSREIRFEKDGANNWIHEAADWQFEAEFDDDGKYIVHESSNDRIDKSYEFIKYTFKSENDIPKKKKLYTANGDIKWKIKRTDKGFKVRLKPFRYMNFEHYNNDYYVLAGDASFGRMLKVEWNPDKSLQKLVYSDSRNMGIEFVPKD